MNVVSMMVDISSGSKYQLTRMKFIFGNRPIGVNYISCR